MKNYLLIAILLLATQIVAQSENTNVFLDRSYWKEQPTLEQVKSDIAAGNDASEFDDHKFDAVTWAIIERVSNDIVWFLLEQDGNDVNKRSHDGRTPIFWAAYKNNLELMRSLVKDGAKTDLIDHHGYSLVNFAATTGQNDPKLYDFCIEHGAELTTELNNDKANPLLLILPHLKSIDMISYFTEKGVSLEQTDENGNNAFVYAAKSGNEMIMDYLLDQGVSPTANNSAAVIFASKGMRRKKNGLKTFQYLQSKGVSMTTSDMDKRNALHYLASGSESTEVIDFFLKHGMSLNEPDTDGETPHLRAVQYNSPEMVSYLLSKQSIEEITTNSKGENIIHLATKRGNPALLEIVLEHDKGINVLSEDGLTPLHIAAMKSKNFDLMGLLLGANADKNIETPFGETAYDLANENEWLEDKKRVKELLK